MSNDTPATRVSVDFRVIPYHLFQPPNELASALSRHALNPGASKKGYYALADPAGACSARSPEGGILLGTVRRTWRENTEASSSEEEEEEEKEVEVAKEVQESACCAR